VGTGAFNFGRLIGAFHDVSSDLLEIDPDGISGKPMIIADFSIPATSYIG
jgi:hypothetical protein